MRILVVEDSERLCRSVGTALRKSGYAVDVASDGQEGLWLAESNLLARLESGFERERQFSADLAHELRTPIAELRALAELALKWPEARGPGTDRDALLIALQMEGLVTRLLALLRSDRGQLSVSREPVRLALC